MLRWAESLKSALGSKVKLPQGMHRAHPPHIFGASCRRWTRAPPRKGCVSACMHAWSINGQHTKFSIQWRTKAPSQTELFMYWYQFSIFHPALSCAVPLGLTQKHNITAPSHGRTVPSGRSPRFPTRRVAWCGIFPCRLSARRVTFAVFPRDRPLSIDQATARRAGRGRRRAGAGDRAAGEGGRARAAGGGARAGEGKGRGGGDQNNKKKLQ